MARLNPAAIKQYNSGFEELNRQIEAIKNVLVSELSSKEEMVGAVNLNGRGPPPFIGWAAK